MKKIEFLKLINDNKSIFKCLTINDATVTSVSKHCAIQICWTNQNNQKTTVKTLRGNVNDLKNIEQLNKYEKWLKQKK